MKKRFLTITAIFFIAVILSSCTTNKDEETIIFGDIDYNAETVEIKRPHNGHPQGSIQGNNYLNLLQGGYFSENDEYYFYSIEYNNDFYLIKESKKSKEKEKIFEGNVRNLFVINDWIYGIDNKQTSECMIAMDLDGNNIFLSEPFKQNIRTMMSDGEKIYFTVDASNIIGSKLKTAIYSCNMDFSNIQIEKEAYDLLSQIDLITIDNGKIFFSETNAAKDIDNFVYIDDKKENYPIIINGNYFANVESLKSVIGNEYNILSINYSNNKIFAITENNNIYFIFKFNLKDKTIQKEEISEQKNIYITSNEFICFDGKYFHKMEGNIWN